MKRIKFWVRKTHKWLGLLLSVQLLLWVISGIYMTVIPLTNVHGNHLIKEAKPPVLDKQLWQPLSKSLIEQYSPVESIRLTSRQHQPLYQLNTAQGAVYLDGTSGREVKPLSKLEIEAIARNTIAFEAPVESSVLLKQYPEELGGRNKSVWQVNFNAEFNASLYFHPVTGELISKRSDIWRMFDFLWMLHIMDYDERSDVNNNLLFVSALTALLFVTAGLWLLVYSFHRRSNHQEAV
mgnify:CR=1 FL=1